MRAAQELRDSAAEEPGADHGDDRRDDRDAPAENADEDDVFYVLDGELTFLLDDGEEAAPAGTFVLVPPGVKHTFRNALDRVTRVLNIHTPAGFDRRLLG